MSLDDVMLCSHTIDVVPYCCCFVYYAFTALLRLLSQNRITNEHHVQTRRDLWTFFFSWIHFFSPNNERRRHRRLCLCRRSSSQIVYFITATMFVESRLPPRNVAKYQSAVLCKWNMLPRVAISFIANTPTHTRTTNAFRWHARSNSGHWLYSGLLRNEWGGGGHCMKRANYSCNTSTHLWPLAYVCTESECVNTRTWVQRNQTSLQLLYVLMVLCRWCTSTKHSSFHLFLSFHYNISCHNLWLALSYSICIQNAQFADYYCCTIQRLFLLLHRSSISLWLSRMNSMIDAVRLTWLQLFIGHGHVVLLTTYMDACQIMLASLIATHNSQLAKLRTSLIRLYIQDMIFRNKPYCPRVVCCSIAVLVCTIS